MPIQIRCVQAAAARLPLVRNAVQCAARLAPLQLHHFPTVVQAAHGRNPPIRSQMHPQRFSHISHPPHLPRPASPTHPLPAPLPVPPSLCFQIRLPLQAPASQPQRLWQHLQCPQAYWTPTCHAVDPQLLTTRPKAIAPPAPGPAHRPRQLTPHTPQLPLLPCTRCLLPQQHQLHQLASCKRCWEQVPAGRRRCWCLGAQRRLRQLWRQVLLQRWWVGWPWIEGRNQSVHVCVA